MFSSRFHWDLRHNRITQLLHSRRLAGARIIDLTESNPTHAAFDYPAPLLDALADPAALRYDPLPAGLAMAREAVSRYYAGRGRTVEPERILLTASTSEGYAYLFKLLTNPGDEVLVPRPSYPLFEFLAAMESVSVRQYPLAYHGRWSIDLDALAHEITPRTRAILLVNPNNPTGSFVKPAELEWLASVCREHQLALISDEVFADYGLGAGRAGLTSLVQVNDCLAFCMSGLSKVAGLPQMKLGWIVACGPAALRTEAFEKLELIADTYLSVATPVQCAASALLAAGDLVRQQIAGRTRANLAWLRVKLADTAVSVLEVEAGWYAVLQVPRIRTEEEWVLRLLEQRGVLVQPGFFYDFGAEAFLIVSLITPEAGFRQGIHAIVSLL